MGATAMALAGICGIGSSNAYADALEVNVAPFCGFRATEDGAVATDIAYTGVGVAGAEVKLNNNGRHKFNIYCNNETGYNVTAKASDMINTANSRVIGYTNDYQGNEEAGAWTAQLSGVNAGVTMAGPGQTPTTLASRDAETPAAGDGFDVEYKIYIGGKTVPGTYAGTATYTIAANPIPGFMNEQSMQTATPARCANTVMYDPEKPDETTITMTDSRTDYKYLVRRLADGNCWMVQNLSLPAETEFENGSALGRTFTTPASSSAAKYWGGGTESFQPRIYNPKNAEEYAGFSSKAHPGTMFNWITATAGSGNYANETELGEADPNNANVAADSVCPKGWRLPAKNQTVALYTNAVDAGGYGADLDKMKDALGVVTSSESSNNWFGSCVAGLVCPTMINSGWWENEQLIDNENNSVNVSVGLYSGSSGGQFTTGGAYSHKQGGLAVRCVMNAAE